MAAFDTRFAPEGHGFGLRLATRVLGFAAGRIAKLARQKGATLVAEPEGFIVEDTEGPLREGELDRAHQWAALLQRAMQLAA